MILDYSEAGAMEYSAKVAALISGSEKYYFVYTFGCQQNEADSERIRAMSEEMGYLPAESAESADMVIVNTCAIRDNAERKALSLIGNFRARKKADSDFILGVVGCMAAEPKVRDALKTDFPYVTFTVEPNMLHRIPELVYTYMIERKRNFVLGEDLGDIVEGLSPVRRDRHKAWVSVMYGCNNFCSYCIVPYVRGRERSRRSSDILAECRGLIDDGAKEITLLGQNVNSYSSDMSFPELLCAIAAIEGDFIIRFMTSHPKDTSDKLIEVMAKYKGRIAPYFHLPLQSGSNTVLKKMNRTYTREKFIETAEKLRRAIPNIALTTDVIVGFPSESEEDFLSTLDILRRVGFDAVYAFLYSPREGTPAAEMENQVPEQIKSERINRLFALQDGISYDKNLPYVGRVFRVLVDRKEERDGKTVYTGRTDTNKLVHFGAEKADIGEFVNVKIEECRAFDLIGSEI